MAQLMLVNPRRKRRRKMSAAQRKYFGGGRRVKRNPTNPRRRRRRKSRATGAVARVARRARRSVRRFARSRSGRLTFNRILSGNVLQSTVLPAAIGAIGAVALDWAYAMLPIPANLKTGQFAAPVKAATVLGVGALASQFLPRQRRMIEGAVAASLTIMVYNFVKAQAQTMLPGVNLGEYVDGVGYTGAGQFLPDYTLPGSGDGGVGEYISGADNSVAWGNSIYGDEVF